MWYVCNANEANCSRRFSYYYRAYTIHTETESEVTTVFIANEVTHAIQHLIRGSICSVVKWKMNERDHWTLYTQAAVQHCTDDVIKDTKNRILLVFCISSSQYIMSFTLATKAFRNLLLEIATVKSSLECCARCSMSHEY